LIISLYQATIFADRLARSQWSKKNGILLEAYSPLGSTGAPQLEDKVVQEIAKAHKVDPANVLISWQVQRGLVVLPKSVTPSRIKSNFQGESCSSPSDFGRQGR
jgi:diketogulonate reductase-like aldo/keto reductase